jgi:transposase
LTLFLTEPGAPLDNGQTERGLKSTILDLKSSLFDKTEYGAFVGDVLMSLLFNARMSGLNPVKWLELILTRSRVSPLHPSNGYRSMTASLLQTRTKTVCTLELLSGFLMGAG